MLVFPSSRLGTCDEHLSAPIKLTDACGSAFSKSVPERIFLNSWREEGETGKLRPFQAKRFESAMGIVTGQIYYVTIGRSTAAQTQKSPLRSCNALPSFGR